MNRAAVTRILVLVAAALAVWWVLTATEWVEVEVDTPPQGEAARHPLFAAELLLQGLGVRVERRLALDTMPPPGARLLLESRHWDLFPERGAQLRGWVEAGGHLVLHASFVRDEALEDWLPVELVDRPGPASAPRAPPPPLRGCRPLAVTPGDGASLRVCANAYGQLLRPAEGVPALWALGGDAGAEVLRVPVGRGTVTVTGPWGFLHNRELVRKDGDHAHVLAAALQVRRGATVWIVREETRPPLLQWIWQQAWVVVLLVLAAIAAWAWRSGVRFGPAGRIAPAERRSMREQVAGTGAFLRHNAPAALHAAQARALHEAARRRLPGYDRLGKPAAAEAIARATGLRAADLERALQARASHFLASDLELLELARRRLAGPLPLSTRTSEP